VCALRSVADGGVEVQPEGQPFFSMDYVKGQNLAGLLRDGPLPARRAAGYVKVIAEAVDYAHQRGILRRG